MKELIFGYTWEEIQAAQQGKPLRHALTQAEKDIWTQKEPGARPEDIDLLNRYGLTELENRGYHGVIDRLAKAGIIDVDR